MLRASCSFGVHCETELLVISHCVRAVRCCTCLLVQDVREVGVKHGLSRREFRFDVQAAPDSVLCVASLHISGRLSAPMVKLNVLTRHPGHQHTSVQLAPTPCASS